jgi:hypothetical protein
MYLHPEDDGTKLFRNAGKHVRGFTILAYIRLKTAAVGLEAVTMKTAFF